MRIPNGMRPIHPGEILRDEYLAPLGMSARKLASELHVPSNRISAILNESRGITGDTALRLARYFGSSAQFWINLQASYELRSAEVTAGGQIEREVQPASWVSDQIPTEAEPSRPAKRAKTAAPLAKTTRATAAKRARPAMVAG